MLSAVKLREQKWGRESAVNRRTFERTARSGSRPVKESMTLALSVWQGVGWLRSSDRARPCGRAGVRAAVRF
eukprot:6175977-Pleurochrysis_carterae.AAC.3